MLYKQYKYKFYLNMNHAVKMEGKMGDIHSHTWEISMGISLESAMDEVEFVRFSDIEKKVNMLLDKYQDKYLNEIAPFNVINPTLENVCDYLYEYVSKGIEKSGWMLLIMEMSETPSRVYQVSGIRTEENYTFM